MFFVRLLQFIGFPFRMMRRFMQPFMKFHVAAAAAACVIAAAVFFSLLYHYDNKYTTALFFSEEAAVLLPDANDENGIQSSEVTWLTGGWEFWPELTTDPENAGTEPESIYIGQYFSFAGLQESGSPFGSGTYRILLSGSGTYTLMVPEVFSSCEIYLNGQRIDASGALFPYSPAVQDHIVSFTLDGEAELLILAANYTHYYSGVTYPPAIGSTQAVSRLIAARMLFYAFLVFTSLTLALSASAIWCGNRRSPASGENFWLGILGLTFSARLFYPFIHMLGSGTGIAAYTLEATMAACGIFCIIRTVSLICLDQRSISARVLSGFSAGFVLAAFLFSAVLIQVLPGFIPVYGQILYWYKAASAFIMIILLLQRLNRNYAAADLLLLGGLLIYAVALIFHAGVLGIYEPARTGWFEEWGTYILIQCFAARMVLRNLDIIQENRRLNSHLQDEVAAKTETLTRLLEERRMLLAGFAHDLKTPVTSITTFARLAEMDSTHLDDESREYLSIIRRKTAEIQEQLRSLNEFTHADTPSEFVLFDLARLVQDFHEANSPDISVGGISFILRISAEPPLIIRGSRQKLESVLQNLVFNAVSFTPAGGTIRLELEKSEEKAIIRVIDNGTGISEQDLPHVFDRFFTKRSTSGGSGLGLFLVRSIVTEHRGSITASSSLEEGTVFTVSLPLFIQSDTENTRN